LKKNLLKLNEDGLFEIREKIFSIEKQKAELLCKVIKLSTKLMSKFIYSFENYQNLKIGDNELLIKIKLFLKITRLVVENSKDAITDCKGEKEKEFFIMYLKF
jgi:hypothetical protein